MAKLLPLTLAIACNAELILDGGDNGWSQWYRSVDGVMGGRSSISVQRDGNVLAASGEIVTAGGGFAGMYTRLGLQGRGGGARRGNGGAASSCLRGHRSIRFSFSCPQSCKNHVL